MNADRFVTSYRQGQRDFCGADLSGIELNGGSFAGVQLRAANLSGAALIRCDLSEADLRDADLQNATLDTSNLREAKLRAANLSLASMIQVDAFAAVLTRACMWHTDATGALLVESDLHAADLTDAKFVSADMSGAVLRSAKLDGVNFAGANLSAANLRYTSGEPCSLVGCQITSGTCELSAWDTTTITRWTCHGAELTRWNLPHGGSTVKSEETQRIDSLYRLLISLFNSTNLRVYVGLNHPDIKAELPMDTGNVSLIVYELIDALNRKGLIDLEFFCSLQDQAPKRQSDIESVARLWNIPLPRVAMSEAAHRT